MFEEALFKRRIQSRAGALLKPTENVRKNASIPQLAICAFECMLQVIQILYYRTVAHVGRLPHPLPFDQRTQIALQQSPVVLKARLIGDRAGSPKTFYGTRQALLDEDETRRTSSGYWKPKEEHY